jgi:hypothetical protein
MAKKKPRGKPFQKGQSGNPGGRAKKETTVEAKKVIADVKALAKEYTEEAVLTLVDIMRDDRAPASARTGAADSLLDRGWGRPTQNVEGKISVSQTLTIEQRLVLIDAVDRILAARRDGQSDARSVEGGVAGGQRAGFEAQPDRKLLS